MGWSLGWDSDWERDIGYGVPAYCDYPGCCEKIDRGLAYVCCGSEPYGGTKGCGLYFCQDHLDFYPQLCERCREHKEPFAPAEELPEWIHHKATHPSWQAWRHEHEVE